jgi:hypothetical protein
LKPLKLSLSISVYSPAKGFLVVGVDQLLPGGFGLPNSPGAKPYMASSSGDQTFTPVGMFQSNVPIFAAWRQH